MDAFKKIGLIFLLCLAVQFLERSVFHPNTKYIGREGNLQQTQQYALQLIASELDKNPDLTYFEVYSSNPIGYGFVVNYNRPLQVLTLEEDFCSGISGQFVEVSPSLMQQVAKQKIAFDSLRTVLKKRPIEEGSIDVPRLDCL